GDRGHHVLRVHPRQEGVQLGGELEARLVVQVRVALFDGLRDLEAARVCGVAGQVRGGQGYAVLGEPLAAAAGPAATRAREPGAVGVVIAAPVPLRGHRAAVPVHGVPDPGGEDLGDAVQVLLDVQLVDPGGAADEIGECVADPGLVVVLDDR